MSTKTFYNWDGTKDFDPREQYEWRLKWLANQIKKREARGEKFTKAQKDKWKKEEIHVKDNNRKDFEIIKKIQKDTCIIVPTHYYHAPWLRACLQSCQATGFFTILAYDNPIWDPKQELKVRFPNATTLLFADYISVKHKTWGSGVGIPHSWNMWYALRVAKGMGFKYVFNLNGDCIMEKPQAIADIRVLLGENDIISCEWHKDKYLGTMAFLGKIDPIMKMWDMNLSRMYQYNFGNAEARMGKFAAELGLNVVEVENPEDPHHKPPGVKGLFRNKLGLRHLHAEHKVRRWERMEPIEPWYCEMEYLNTHEKNTLQKYWEKGHQQDLFAWWKK